MIIHVTWTWFCALFQNVHAVWCHRFRCFEPRFKGNIHCHPAFNIRDINSWRKGYSKGRLKSRERDHFEGVFAWENSHRREFHSGMTSWFRITFTWWLGFFIISGSTCWSWRSHLGLTKITHALPVPVYLQTDFTPKRVVVWRLHDTVAKSRTGVKFSPRCESRGELTSRLLAPAWHFVAVSCKQM